MNQILVGIDESDLSTAALDWAIDEARRRGAGLRVLHAVLPWLLRDPAEAGTDPKIAEIREWMVECGRQTLDRGLTRVRDRAPDLEATGAMVAGPSSQALVRAAEGALMTVVGTHGANALSGMVLGSVAWQVAAHAPGPVVVVRGDGSGPHGEIVVGVDGSDGSDAALGFAFQEAALRGARLRAVLAWTFPMPTGGPAGFVPAVYDPEIVAADESRVLTEALAGWREKYPEVTVAPEVVHGTAARVLGGASARADLLVVGSRGRGGFAGLVLGSVSHAMLHRSHCPVAVIRPTGDA
ncbi:universal stress protein [Actinomadura hibisca]|uniref:universal stress protein n=1 Tax=Actinomadura hibisca TaxID=68565 RepID=UPI00082B5532|nr:universal stress protein [Actinomadura hibisca]